MQTQAVGLHGHRKTAPLFSTSKNTFFRGTQKVLVDGLAFRFGEKSSIHAALRARAPGPKPDGL